MSTSKSIKNQKQQPKLTYEQERDRARWIRIGRAKRLKAKEERMALQFTKDAVVGANFHIGDYTYGVPRIIGQRWHPEVKLTIGRFCSIGGGVSIYLGGNHRTDWITTYPFSDKIIADRIGDYDHKKIPGHPASGGDVYIGNDVWLANNATIMSGVTIGNGCVVAANATVPKGHYEPYSIIAGNPGKIIKKRFTDDQIRALLLIRWWDWNIEAIKIFLPELCSGNVDNFIKTVLKGKEV